MSTIEKLKKRFYGSPVPKDMTVDEISRLADHYGCTIRTGGNHQIAFVNTKTGKIVPLPQHGKTVKQAYIRELRELFGDDGTEGK